MKCLKWDSLLLSKTEECHFIKRWPINSWGIRERSTRWKVKCRYVGMSTDRGRNVWKRRNTKWNKDTLVWTEWKIKNMFGFREKPKKVIIYLINPLLLELQCSCSLRIGGQTVRNSPVVNKFHTPRYVATNGTLTFIKTTAPSMDLSTCHWKTNPSQDCSPTLNFTEITTVL